MIRNGKIARLPKDLRDLVNCMMDDGAQHRSIIMELEKHRHRWPEGITEISEMNLSNWRAGGYVDWTREQELQGDLRARREFALSLVEDTPEGKLNEAVVQIGVAQLYHVLAACDRDSLQAKLRDDPNAYARLVNSLSRLSRTALDVQKYKDHVQQRKARIEAELEKATESGGLSDQVIATIQNELKLL
jgi:hypothetical protein